MVEQQTNTVNENKITALNVEEPIEEPEEHLDPIEQYEKEKDADIILLSGPISLQVADDFIDFVNDIKPRRPNVILYLCTWGGDAEAAYIIARTLKRKYNKFSVYISGYCKSAGTLIVLGADEIAMGERGELGPLDIQLPKEDSLISRASGLDSHKSIDVIRDRAFNVFEDIFINLILRSGGIFSTRTAARIATDLVVGLLEPIAEQIDPLKLTENQRALDIASLYGKQLGADRESIKRLIYYYPSHNYIIDIEEAAKIFGSHARPFNKIETVIEKMINYTMIKEKGVECIREPNESSVVALLNEREDTEFTNNEDKEVSFETKGLDDGTADQNNGKEASEVNTQDTTESSG